MSKDLCLVDVLEPGEVIEAMFVDHRAGSGEWAKCKACDSDVFRPQALPLETRIYCKCGAVAFEYVRFAVRRRSLLKGVNCD
jgi:hypothetical protein